MKKLTVVITILLVLCSFSLANAFQVVFNNDTDYQLKFELTWLECPWEGFEGIAKMSGGSLQPGEKFILERNYNSGAYIATWENYSYTTKYTLREYSIRVPSEKGKLIITPDDGMTFCPGI